MQVNVEDVDRAMSNGGLHAPKIVLEKCVILCDRYSISAEDLVNHADVFLDGKHDLTLDAMGTFEQKLRQNSHMKENVHANKHKSAIETPSPAIPSSSVKRLNYATPADDKALKFPRKTGDNISPDSNQTPVDTNAVKLGVNLFTSRTNQGECVLDYNNQLGSRGPFIPSNRLLGKRCDVITDIDDIFDNVRQRYRFMFTALDERARAMEKQMIKMRDAICSLHNIDVNELQPVGMPSQNTVFVCGRICCEDASGRMNKSTIMLEGSLSESNGRRVQLDLQPLQSFSLFPGQIVVVEGVNSSGRKMAAKQIFDGCPAPLVKTTASKLLEYHHSTLYQNGKALTIVAAAGPFTTSDNLDYLPLSFLLSNMLSQMPDVIILIGPFVDVSQPLLTEGDVTLSQKNDNGMITEQHIASFEMVFIEKIVRDCLQKFFNAEEDCGTIPTQILLVPSLQDGHHEYVFPQPPFGDRDPIHTSFFVDPLGILKIPHNDANRKQVYLLPNPCMFRINEVVIGITSQDVPFFLSADEISHNRFDHRVSRLLNHTLLQQSYYPQFPPLPNAGAQLDMRQAKHWMMKYSPDILIVPSKLAQLTTSCGGTLAINPGQLSKGTGGGTYATLNIHPVNEEELRKTFDNDDKAEIAHDIPSRTSVLISRI